MTNVLIVRHVLRALFSLTICILTFAVSAETNQISDGTTKTYFPSGKLQCEQNYKNGKLEGTSKWYFENGILESSIEYHDGLQHGVSAWYRADGSLDQKDNYYQGKRLLIASNPQTETIIGMHCCPARS